MRHLFLIALMIGSNALAQTYVWTDEKGRKHYSDQPPPVEVKAEKKRFSANGDTEAVPYRVREAARRHPVTLYTGQSCPLCADARSLLQQRQIPFSEKKIETQEQFDAMTREFDGNGIVPSIQVGRKKFSGYIEGTWKAMLDDAGYPTDLRGLD
ncbi:MAG: glutaredoxin family protein [Rhodocyclaceae bacterium]|nr:glutaredoxin family protein [Rhodocyclaceae bacterium]